MDLYPWLRYIHVLGVLLFVLGHGSVGRFVSTLVLVFGLGLVVLAIWRSRAAPATAPA